MLVTFYAEDNEFAAASGDNVNVSPSYSYFDHPPNSTKDLTITANVDDDEPFQFDVGETYDITWSGHGGGIMEDAVIIRSDYVGPGQGAIVFEGTNSLTGEAFQMVWTPGFDLEQWYWDNGGGPSSPNAFWTSDQNSAETYRMACYAAGTKIDTPTGPMPIEQLQPGDSVWTLDRGRQQIRWVFEQKQQFSILDDTKRPVLIATDALGPGRPESDLIVSPQHRILVGGHGQLVSSFPREVFVPAKALTQLRGIRHMRGKKQITWHHFSLARHDVVSANGCHAESMLLGPMVMADLSAGQMATLKVCYPQTSRATEYLNGPLARPCLRVKQVMKYLRHPMAHSIIADLNERRIEMANANNEPRLTTAAHL